MWKPHPEKTDASQILHQCGVDVQEGHKCSQSPSDPQVRRSLHPPSTASSLPPVSPQHAPVLPSYCCFCPFINSQVVFKVYMLSMWAAAHPRMTAVKAGRSTHTPSCIKNILAFSYKNQLKNWTRDVASHKNARGYIFKRCCVGLGFSYLFSILKFQIN